MTSKEKAQLYLMIDQMKKDFYFETVKTYKPTDGGRGWIVQIKKKNQK